MFGNLVGWCCSWARLAEGICGILTLGFFTPYWGLAVVRFFNRLRIRKLQQNAMPMRICNKCGGIVVSKPDGFWNWLKGKLGLQHYEGYWCTICKEWCFDWAIQREIPSKHNTSEYSM